MAAYKIAALAASQVLQGSLMNKASLKLTNQLLPIVVTSISRHLSTIKLTNNLVLLTGDKRSVKVVDLKVTEPQNRPLVVILSWLMAKPKHIHKFANYYIDKGFDVLNVNTSPWQLLWPVKGTQIIAGNILKFLDINRGYSPIVLHGFSMGGYQWSEVLVKIENNQEQYKNVTGRIVGQIWDSVVDYQEITVGFGELLPNSMALQRLVTSYINFHFKFFHNIATSHYIKCSKSFRSGLIKSPVLILISKSDPIAQVSTNLSFKEAWEKAGLQVNWKCWEDSPHVGHYRYHTKEYIELLDNFLKLIGTPTRNEKL